MGVPVCVESGVRVCVCQTAAKSDWFSNWHAEHPHGSVVVEIKDGEMEGGRETGQVLFMLVLKPMSPWSSRTSFIRTQALPDGRSVCLS